MVACEKVFIVDVDVTSTEGMLANGSGSTEDAENSLLAK